ncbi:MAG: hypothetical protein BYD32DRAFT_144413 [Podila humilis]|nr:MAG: hypothetical protein BYD32DRAFT_144413 [Podila humilis]
MTMAEQGSIRKGPGRPSVPPNDTGNMATSVLQRNPIGLVRATSNISLAHDSNGQGSNNNNPTSTNTVANSETQQQALTQPRVLPTATINDASNNDTSNNNAKTRQNKRKIFLHPLTGSPLRIYITRHTPDREDLKKLIHNHGGNVTEHEKVAYIRLAPPGYRYVEQSYSTDWVRDCVRKGHLITLNDAMGYRLKLANKQDKTHYTIEDDNILRRFIAEKIASGAKINGKKIYQELAAAHPRHTMESWRTRATKELRLTETPSPSPYAASKALRDQISVARNLTLRGMAAQPPSPPGATPTPKNRLTMAQDSKSTSHVSAGQSSQRGDSSQAISSCPSPAPRSSDPPPLTPPALDLSMNRLPTSLTSSRGLPSMDLSSFNLPSSSTRDISGSQVIKPRLEDLLHVSDFSSDDEEEAMRIKEVQTPSQRRKGPRSDPHDVASATKNSTTADIAVAKTVTLSLISPPIQEESGDKPISAPEPIVMLSPDLVPAIATTDPTLTLPSTALTEPDDIAIAQGIIQRMASVSPEVQEEHEGLEDMDLEVPAGQIFQEDHQELEDEVLLEGQPSSEDHMKLVEELFPEGESFTEPHRELEEDLAQPEFDSLPQDDFSLEEPRSLEDQELLRRSHSQQSWVSPSKSSTSLSAEHDMDRSSPAFSSQDGLDSGAEVQVPEKFFTGHLRKKKPRIPGRPKNIKYGLTRASATGIPATESTATSARLSMVGSSEQALPPTAKSLGPNSHASNEDNALDMENIMEEPERLQTTILENTNGIELQSVDDLDGLSEDDANIANRILDRHRGSVPSVSSSIALDTYRDLGADEIPEDRGTLSMTQAGMKESQEVETVPSHNMDHGYEEEEDEPLLRRRPTMAKEPAAPTATTFSALPLASAEVESGPRQFPQPSPRAKSLSEPSPESLRAPQQDSAKESEAPQQHSERNDGQTEGSPAKSTPLESMSVEPEEALSRPRIQATPQVELAIPKTVVQSRKEPEAAKEEEVHPVVPEVAVKTLQAAPEVQQQPRKVASRPRSSTPRDPPELRKTRTGAMASKRLSVEVFEVPDDDPPPPKPRRTPVQNNSAAEKFYAARAEKSAKLLQDQEGSEGQVRLTQDQLVEYLRFQYKDDIRKLCVLGLLRPLQAVDILDACSGDFIAAKTLVRKGMTDDIQSKFWTGVDDTILHSKDESRLDELGKRYTLREIVNRTEYLARSRKEAEHHFGLGLASPLSTPLKRPAPESRSTSVMTDDLGAQSPLTRFSDKASVSLYKMMESKRQRFDESGE